MRRGDAIEVVRYGRRGKPKATDVPERFAATVIKAVGGYVWIDRDGTVDRVLRIQVRTPDDRGTPVLPAGHVAGVDAGA